ncbi:sugar transferase [Fictibacillus arsenicus]|uniref:Sugar transferase n=1 Tax=Fictibacillus arsenicus TaxID=255247 RepID=A0A1V3GD02_9BACL|nr:sugar transferase [Fictibacillus arsenicus]OOE14582.1 sugar transferase [Fictibacillus arsenicus]
MKRAFDVFCATGLLFLFILIMGVVAILVKRKLGSPVIFKQQRPGLQAKPFYLYKFRTMTEQRDSLGNLLPDEVRLTAFGQFLRKYSLDELPQLWNVLKGDISLVGPRPLLMSYLELYTKEQMKRHDVKPGITGWAQVNGRNTISWEEKFRLDVWYAQNHSFLLDLKILLLTFKKVFKTEGIKHANHATMPVYKGSLTEYEKM